MTAVPQQWETEELQQQQWWKRGVSDEQQREEQEWRQGNKKEIEKHLWTHTLGLRVQIKRTETMCRND